MGLGWQEEEKETAEEEQEDKDGENLVKEE